MRRLGGTEQLQHSSQKIFCFVHLNFALGLVDFCQRLCPPRSCQTKEETDHRPEAQGRICVPCCTAKKQEAPGGSLSSTRAWAGPKAGQSPPHQPCCAVQSSGALCTLQSQLGVTEPSASVLCCSHPQKLWSTQASTSTSGFQIARAGQFGPGAFITNLFSSLQSPATKETKHTDSQRRCSISLIFYCTPE